MSSTETERWTEEWAPLHVFLPMSLQPRFLRDVIRPLMDGAGLRNRFWYLRYWQGGPHIRLRLHEAPPGTVEAVRDALAAAMPVLDPAQAVEYEQQASHQPGLAELEGARPVEVRAAGTVERAEYAPEYAKYGGTTGLRVAEELFRSTSTAVLDLLGGMTDRQLAASPAGPAIRVMAMSLRGSGMDPAQSREFLGHYEKDWRRWVPPGYDEQWEGLYEKTRGRVQNMCRAVWLEGATDVFHDTYARALNSARAAQDDRTSAPERAGLTSGDVTELALERTPYVHCLANYIHTTNNRLGILPSAEAFLAHVIRRALEEIEEA
ncbi:lantibiotic dehydratase C-terminal domain-containing protein [Streptomyces sp. NPDC015232]|uniref:lantibiotic dehydratase C-terminal domain-containing protein n=1 Tax=unclassified Streptomyces TaxID=2593676 RepID=UPI0036F96D4A